MNGTEIKCAGWLSPKSIENQLQSITHVGPLIRYSLREQQHQNGGCRCSKWAI